MLTLQHELLGQPGDGSVGTKMTGSAATSNVEHVEACAMLNAIKWCALQSTLIILCVVGIFRHERLDAPDWIY